MGLIAALFFLAAIAFFGGAVCIVRFKPPKSSSRLVNAAIAITALALLVFFILPRAELAFNQFSSEEKDDLARKHFDPAYGLARRSIENCRDFEDYIGGLSSLDISHRESFVRQAGEQTSGFFDFDYVGSDNAGRLTVGFSFEEFTRDGPTPGYELAGGQKKLRVLVYAGDTSQHYEVNCPWFIQGK